MEVRKTSYLGAAKALGYNNEQYIKHLCQKYKITNYMGPGGRVRQSVSPMRELILRMPRPSPAHRMFKRDEDAPWSPENLVWMTAADRHAATMRVVPLSRLEKEIIRPGIEKHLVPLALYKGHITFGRIQRLWNFVISMMLVECDSIQEGLILSNNEKFAHLCGPEGKIWNYSTLQSFLNRLSLNPKVTANIQGLTEYVGGIYHHPFELQPVSLISHYRGCAPWRTYQKPSGAREEGGNVKPEAHKSAAISYPYVIFEKDNPANRLALLVNKIVPRGLDESLRADVCQDLIVDMLSGALTEDALKGSPRKFMAPKLRANNLMNRWGVSMDTDVVDLIQHEEAKRRFDDYVEDELDDFELTERAMSNT